MDWQKRCIALEMQLLRFRLQAGKIRQLLAEKMQELEQRVTEADQRAENAEKQVQIMEEKLKSVNMHPSESESSLYRRYQELTNQIQEKDMMVKKLEAQLEKQNLVRAQEAKIIEEKAAKIKDWVTFKLREMEMENQQLKMTNLKQSEQILLLQDKLQTVLERPISPCSPKPLVVDAQLASTSPLHNPSYFGTSPTHDECGRITGSCKPGSNTIRGTSLYPQHSLLHDTWNGKRKASEAQDSQNASESMSRHKFSTDRGVNATGTKVPDRREGMEHSDIIAWERGGAGASERDHSSDELNSKFRLQRLRSSSSSSSSSSSAYETSGPRSFDTPTPTPKSPPPVGGCLSQINPAPLALPSGTSMTLPKVRTPLTPRDSIQLLKKHHSQPQPGLERLHHVNVTIDIGSSSSPYRCSLPLGSASTIGVEETDIDEGSMEGVVEGFTEDVAPHDGVSFVGLAEELELLDPEALKPPTPPLHRFRSWESHIYAVAKSGMRVSEASPGARNMGRVSTFPQYPAAGPFTNLIYKNISIPVYSTLKGKATQISSAPLPDEDSGSEDDSSSLASLRTSTVGPEKKGSTPGSPRAVKRGVSMSSISSESDYAIPPDAYSLDSDYSEPEQKVQRTSSYSCESVGPETLEKSGYLLKMGSQVKAWKRRWFILRNGEILYYKSPLITEKKTFCLTADSPNILEEWIRVLQNILKVQASGPFSTETQAKPTVRGWLTKVKHGHSKLVWCTLIGKIFYYYRNQDDKFPLGQLHVREARVEEVDRSCDSDEDYEAGGRGFLSSHCTLVVHPKEQSPTYLLIGTKQEKDTWLYHLTVAAGNCASLKVATDKEGLRSPLTTLPSEALQTEALKLFKSCQLFINVLVEAPSIDYHTSLAQSALQVCLTHPELQNEMYCQLIKQTNRRMPNNYSLTQHHFLWYLRQYLQRNADPKSEVGKYAVYCQRSVERVLQNGEREAKPSRMEIVSILLRNPYHHSLPFSIPVHFMNNTYQVVGFDGSTTVEEFVNTLNQRAGMRKPQLSGFALFTDDPSGKDLEHCLQPATKQVTNKPICMYQICDVISKWEQALKELQPGKCEGTRIVRLTYKSRLCFRAQAKGETERERLLLAYQVNEEVHQGHFPVSKELALEVAALMAQVEHGDVDRAPASPGGSPQPKIQQIMLQVLDRFYPRHYKQDRNIEQLRELAERLATKWSVLQGCTAAECVRIYLTVARKWPLFGAKLFSAKPQPPSTLEQTQVWLAVSEDGLSVLDYSMHLLVTYPYQSVITFGGCKEDFMVVVSQIKDQALGKKTVDKLIFAMAKPKILELTLLMASYINWTSGFSAAGNQAQSSTLGSRNRKLRDIDSRHFPSMTYTTKGPTLL
ncbi:hypothetical protein Q7C36_011545 [Tachysurus vachellii]|uniref:Pleckstrin homology domain-containing family H member 1 n=1 Tax=Tachysurus vachellii TaxID=175792 RepID=A0AA88SLE5_TACVA|nr:hypothetical protein Q7C36_011545 [Tachysurus vachellii]